MTERIWTQSYDAGVPAELVYDELTLDQFPARSAARLGGKTALTFMNARLSYAELAEQVERFATALHGLGVRQGTRVAIQLPNLPQAVIAFYGAMRCGAQVVMTNPLYTRREILHQWRDADCRVVITTDFLWDQKLRDMRADLPVESYVVASIPEYLAFPLNLLAPHKLKRQDPPLWAKLERAQGVYAFRELVRDTRPSAPRVAIEQDDVALLQYTGGTTGLSKAALLTQRNLSRNVQQINAWFTDVEYGAEVVLCALPLFHVFGLTVGMNWGIYCGATLVLMPNPRDFKALVGSVAKQRVTIFPGVPALFNGLNNYPGIESIDVSSVKSCFSGSAPIPPDVLQRFEELTGARIIEGFGMSETSPVTHCNPLKGTRKIGMIGLPISDTDARIVDIEDGATELPVGQAGELVVRGPQVMQGYWQRPEETAQALRGGWMHTGDMALVDEQGYFKIVGRLKDMINVSGLKVFPDEVDAVLVAHPKILEAATIGIPDESRGELVKSFIVLQPGASLSKAEVQAFCRESLAPYKVPRQIEFLESLPKSSVLKVLRRELRERELAKQAGGAG